MKTKLWGIVGAGRVAGLFASALRRTAGGKLLAVTSRLLEDAQAFAEAYGPARAFPDLDAMLALPELDVVYIASPNHLHRTQCLAALSAGKAVLCEKPIGMNAAEAVEIAQAARAAGLFCMEAMWTQFVPAVAEAARLVKAGAIGEPRWVSGSMGAPTHFDPGNRFFDPVKGGGAMLDRGCYPISLALRLLGPLAEVQGASVLASTGVDETAVATLRFESGAIAQIAASLTAYLANDFIIAGTSGHIVLGRPITRPTELSLSRTSVVGVPSEAGARLKTGGRQGLSEKLKSAVQDNAILKRALSCAIRAPRFLPLHGNGYEYEIAEVHRCLDARMAESSIVPLSLSISTLEVIDAVRNGGQLERPAG